MSENNPLISNQELLISNMIEIQALIKILSRKGITNEDEILEEVKIIKADIEQKIKNMSKAN